MMKNLLIAALVAGSLGSITLPASAAVVVVREAPPPPRAERVPAPRQGYSWINGHWEWHNQPAWVERDGRWEMTRGSWRRGARDNDGDGVPNRADSRSNNPNRH